jgi:hypothetical protein
LAAAATEEVGPGRFRFFDAFESSDSAELFMSASEVDISFLALCFVVIAGIWFDDFLAVKGGSSSETGKSKMSWSAGLTEGFAGALFEGSAELIFAFFWAFATTGAGAVARGVAFALAFGRCTNPSFLVVCSATSVGGTAFFRVTWGAMGSNEVGGSICAGFGGCSGFCIFFVVAAPGLAGSGLR